MDRLQKQALEKHKIIRYKDLFVKVMDTYKTLLEAETEQLRVGAVVGHIEQYHCELHDFGRKDKPCDKQCDGCKAMNLD